MRSIFGDKHDAPVEVDEIIFEHDRTVVVCVDGETYEISVQTVMGEPLTQAVHIEMYPSATSIEHKAYMN